MLQTSLPTASSRPACPTWRPDTPDVERRITQSMPLVRRLAWQVHAKVASAIDVEDLTQIGLIALIEAARSYEDRGHAFSTYATLRVRGAMIDHLRKEARMARSAMQRRRSVEAVRAKLEQRLCRRACDVEMATEMGIGLTAYHDLATALQPVRDEALDDAYSDHLMVFADAADLPDAALSHRQLVTALRAAMDGLNDREKTILQLYFVDELNLDDIGLVLGVGAARICQIKKAALTKLRGLMPHEAAD